VTTGLSWPLGQHGTVIAITGGGKTFWSKNGWLPTYIGTGALRAILVDVEAGFDFPEPIFKARTVEQAVHLSKSDPKKSFIARVEINPETEMGLDQMDELCYGVLHKGHRLGFYIDECTAFTPNNTIPPGYKALITRARKREISVLSGTQRPTMLHKDVYTQSIHHVWMFVGEYDASNWLRQSARQIMEKMSEIPYGSFQWLYQEPSGVIHKFAPVQKYPWERFKP
jgi:hypothetical protein